MLEGAMEPKTIAERAAKLGFPAIALTDRNGLYVEIVRRNDPVEAAAEDALIDLAYARDLPLVATNPAAYTDPTFHAAHDTLLCIAGSAYVESADRATSSADAWLKDGAAMAE